MDKIADFIKKKGTEVFRFCPNSQVYNKKNKPKKYWDTYI
jgi:hypothetical protein